MADYLQLESDGHLLLEDSTGSLLLESSAEVAIAEAVAASTVATVTASTWTTESEELFLFLWNEFGRQMLDFDGAQLKTVRTHFPQSFEMTETGYDRKAECAYDVLRKEAYRAGLYQVAMEANPRKKRPIVKSNGLAFAVWREDNDDTSDACIKLLARQYNQREEAYYTPITDDIEALDVATVSTLVSVVGVVLIDSETGSTLVDSETSATLVNS